LAIDSSIRDGEDYPRYAGKDSNLTKLSERPSMFARKTRLGSKMFIVDSNMSFLLVKEVPNKKWDLTGGHREQKETPWEAMKRECYEETGLVISESRVEFLGESSATTIDEFVNSHVYLMFVDKFPEKWRTSTFRSVSWSQMSRVCLSDSVEWMNRLWSHFLTRFPTVTTFYSYWSRELKKYGIRSPVRERLLRTIDLSPEDRMRSEFLRPYQSELYSDLISAFHIVDVMNRGSSEFGQSTGQVKMDTGSDDDDDDWSLKIDNKSGHEYKFGDPSRWNSAPNHVAEADVPEKTPLLDLVDQMRLKVAPHGSVAIVPPGGVFVLRAEVNPESLSTKTRSSEVDQSLGTKMKEAFAEQARKRDEEARKCDEESEPDFFVVKFVQSNPGCRSQDLSKKFGSQILKIAHKSSKLKYESDGQDKRWYTKEKS